MTRKHIQHLYWRAGFGISPGRVDGLVERSREQVVDDLFKASESISPLTIDLSEFDDLDMMAVVKDRIKLRKFINRSMIRVRDLNHAWIERMMNSDEILRERMVLFWANHFVCRDNNVFFIQKFNNTLRRHALGHFGDFIKAVSKEPAMLKYLNNKQNTKWSPNENFAREMMELFTLGTGHYSEADIKESARAFTGYFHGFKGEFILRAKQHDFGIKSFMGKRGKFQGDDIIDIILEKPDCARFICRKIYRYFVNENVDEGHIDSMMKVFYPSYRIDRLIAFVLKSDWFYDDRNIGTKIKSPIELLVGINQIVPITFKNKSQYHILQKLLGQVLLDPPNVAGWQGGKSWININTMLLRLKMPSILLSDGYISMQEEGDFMDSLSAMVRERYKKNNRFDVDADWAEFESEFGNTPKKEFPNAILQTGVSSGSVELLKKFKHLSNKDFCIQIMSLPEYQMC